MSFQHKVARWGGGVDWDEPTQIPNGVAVLCQNSRFRAESVGTRYGRQHTMIYPQFEPGGVTGIDVLNVLVNNPQQIPVVFTDKGLLLRETPPGSGTLVAVEPPLVLPTAAYMQDALAYNRMYMTISDMLEGLVQPIVLDGPSGLVSPVGQNPTGALWAQNTVYQVGDLVRAADGRWWRCTGSISLPSSATPPKWPSANGYFSGSDWVPAVVADPPSESDWEEWTPNVAQYLPPPDVTGASTTHTPGAGTITSGKDVYIKFTYLIPQSGESPRSPAISFINTSANDAITVKFGSGAGPFLPRWMAEINLQPGFFYPFSMNVWIAAVATGAAAPADSAYGLQGAGYALGSSILLTSLTVATPAGQSVVGVTITAGGFYSTYPSVSFTGGGGSGATGRVNVRLVLSGPRPPFTYNYIVTGVTILSEGSGYTSPPTMVFSPAGFGAAGTTVLGGGDVPSGAFYPQGCAIVLLNPGNSTVFIGEAGTRYLIVLRENLNGSLSPVDPGSPIALNFAAQLEVNIISIVRDGSGNVTATVSDVTGFAPGGNVAVQGCTTVTTFNGSFTVTNVQETLSPEGILQWTDPAHLSAANDNTGSVLVPAGPPPIAFLPPAGPFASQNIAAFTVAAPQDGQPIALQAGPFTYLPASNPARNFSTAIVSMSGPKTLTFAGVTLTRFAGGMVSATMANIAGIVAGAFLTVSIAADASFDGFFLVTGVASGTGTAGVVTWTQVDTAAALTTGTITIQTSVSGQVKAIVQDASGLAVGGVVNIIGAAPSAFNGPAALASVLGNVVTFPSVATGAATTPGTMAVLQDLPTTSSAAVALVTSISRDFVGNVTCQIPLLGGWGAGQVITTDGVLDNSFDGIFELTSATLNNDGITATLAWLQSGQIAAASSSGGTISSIADFLINFDDNFLSNGQDVTSQLTAMAPPPSVDVYYSETLDRMVYTRGGDTQHYFSNIGDAENINQSGGILGVAASNGAPTVCFREMKSGELLSLKSNAGYAIEQNSLTPDKWTVVRRWKERGPVNARAVDLGPDFLIIFVEYTGPYRYYQGELTWIGQEKQGTWDRVNWAAKQTISVAVDDDNKTIHFLLPLDGATTPNKDVTLNYFNGWQDPLILNMMGQVIPNRYGRRWSEDDLAALSMKVVERSLNPPVDSRINDKQLLFGRSAPGGDYFLVDMAVPDVRSDDGIIRTAGVWNKLGIDWKYQPAYAQTPTCDVLRLVKFKGQLLGSGPINFQSITNDPTVEVEPVTVLADGSGVATSFSRGMRIEDSSNVGIVINNGAQPDVWAEMHTLIIGGNEQYPSEKTE